MACMRSCASWVAVACTLDPVEVVDAVAAVDAVEAVEVDDADDVEEPFSIASMSDTSLLTSDCRLDVDDELDEEPDEESVPSSDASESAPPPWWWWWWGWPESTLELALFWVPVASVPVVVAAAVVVPVVVVAAVVASVLAVWLPSVEVEAAAAADCICSSMACSTESNCWNGLVTSEALPVVVPLVLDAEDEVSAPKMLIPVDADEPVLVAEVEDAFAWAKSDILSRGLL